MHDILVCVTGAKAVCQYIRQAFIAHSSAGTTMNVPRVATGVFERKLWSHHVCVAFLQAMSVRYAEPHWT